MQILDEPKRLKLSAVAHRIVSHRRWLCLHRKTMMTREGGSHRMHFVLDTNGFRGMSIDQIERLAARGIPLRISEIAIRETMAHAGREYRSGSTTLARARGLFASRLRSLWPMIDQQRPFALCGAEAILAARANAAGDRDPLGRSYGESVRFCEQAMSFDLSEREWLPIAQAQDAWLAKLDAVWSDHNQPLAELLLRRYADAEERQAVREAWERAPLQERYDEHLKWIAECHPQLTGVLDRFDALLRVLSWRMMNSEHTFGRAAENDGADLALLHHVADEGILVTDDAKLLGAVTASGTAQGPWFRSVSEALGQPLPTCAPWDSDATQAASKFERTYISAGQVGAAQWPGTRVCYGQLPRPTTSRVRS